MKRMEQLKNSATFKQMCDDFFKHYGYRSQPAGKVRSQSAVCVIPNGSGVVAGITNVCCVHGYVISECDKQPIEGELIYRGYNIRDIVNDVLSSGATATRRSRISSCSVCSLTSDSSLRSHALSLSTATFPCTSARTLSSEIRPRIS